MLKFFGADIDAEFHLRRSALNNFGDPVPARTLGGALLLALRSYGGQTYLWKQAQGMFHST